jgi:hypothetical protein
VEIRLARKRRAIAEAEALGLDELTAEGIALLISNVN